VAERETLNRPTGLFLCMGSSCHKLGVQTVLHRMQLLLDAQGLADLVELKGSFCLGPCGQGIVMRFGDIYFTHLSPDNINERFEHEILPVIRVSQELEVEGQ
jgi:NADH:ubiquinone oxidoreductase subunit E